MSLPPNHGFEKMLEKTKKIGLGVLKLKFQRAFYHKLQKQLYPGFEKIQREIVINFSAN